MVTPVNPPVPGMCCCRWTFHGLLIAQLSGLFTLAAQCIVPSELQEIVTVEIEGQTLHASGVRVPVGVWVGVALDVGVRVDVLVAVAVLLGVSVRTGVMVNVPVRPGEIVAVGVIVG